MVKRCPKCHTASYTQKIDGENKALCHKCGYRGRFSEGMPLTNADRIRSMKDEELAEMLCNTVTFEKGEDLYLSTYVDDEVEMPSTYGDILEWLQQPAED